MGKTKLREDQLSSADVKQTITQTAHGLTAGTVLRYNGTSYVAAKADTAQNSEVIGIIESVVDTNNFIMVSAGLCDGFTGLTAGTMYFLSSSTAGELTSTEPTTVGEVTKPMLLALSATTGHMVNMRGVVISASANGNAPAGGTTNYVLRKNSATDYDYSWKVQYDAPSTISGTDIDWTASTVFTKTLAANTTFTFSNSSSGQVIIVSLTNTASNYTVTWPTVKWTAQTAPTQTTGAKTDIYQFFNIGGVYYGTYAQNF